MVEMAPGRKIIGKAGPDCWNRDAFSSHNGPKRLSLYFPGKLWARYPPVANTGPGGGSGSSRSRSDVELVLQVGELVTGQGQVGLALVQGQVEEQAQPRPVGDQPDQVVLRAEGDQDVLDAVVQAESLHGAQLGPDDLGVAGRGDV